MNVKYSVADVHFCGAILCQSLYNNSSNVIIGSQRL